MYGSYRRAAHYLNRRSPVLVATLLYPVPILIFLLLGHILEAFLVGLCGATIWGLHHVNRRYLLTLWAVIAQIAFVYAGHVAQEWVWPPLEEDRVRIYVVLSFEGESWEAPPELLLDTSRKFRSSLEDAFSNLPSTPVQIQPEAFDQETFEAWSHERSPAGVIDLLKRRGPTPDLVLRNHLALETGEAGDATLILLSNLNRFGSDRLAFTGKRIREKGSPSEVRYLTLRAVFQFLQVLQDDFAFPKEDELHVKKRILEMYQEVLSAYDEKEIEQAVEEALRNETVLDETLASLLDAHQASSQVSAEGPSPLDARRQANVAKITINQ